MEKHVPLKIAKKSHNLCTGINGTKQVFSISILDSFFSESVRKFSTDDEIESSKQIEVTSTDDDEKQRTVRCDGCLL